MLWKRIKWWQSSKQDELPVDGQVVGTLPVQTTHSGTESRYFNRELSDLAFIERVLDEASNEKHPLLERLAFLAISASVLDQYYTVRIAKIQRKIEKGNNQPGIDGLTPLNELTRVNTYADYLLGSQQTSWTALRDELEGAGIILAEADNLVEEDLEYLRQYFDTDIKHALTPFMIDREHPFPYIPSGGLCVVAEGRTRLGLKKHLLLPLPPSLKRFHMLPGNSTRVMTLESLIIANIQSLFSDIRIQRCGTFQILRDNDLALEERFDDLREMVQTGIEMRHRANVVRLKFDPFMSEDARFFVAEELGVLDKDQVENMRARGIGIETSEFVAADTLVGLSDALSLIHTSLAPRFPHLMFKHHEPRLPNRVKSEEDRFEMIKRRDIMLHYPYDTFDVLVDFINQAAADPDVKAIKQTLYRTSESSPIVQALISAAESGKAVFAVIELEARDDEKANILLAKRLEAAGAQIVYGIVDLKVHCKMTLVVRNEEDGDALYTHFGTGNYHPGTAKIYTDLSYFTRNNQLGNDANKVFNYLASESIPNCEQLSVAPVSLRSSLYSLIEAEIKNSEQGLPSGIWAKVNSLTDPELIDKLYEASNAGVNIELVVRRHCRLKPGIPGLSENIQVRSIVGRFLEHSRVYCFANGHSLPHSESLVYLSSADWMERNLNERVEVMVPLNDPLIHQQVLEDVMLKNIEDTDQSWILGSNGRYKRAESTGVSVQNWSINNPTRSSI